MAERDVLDPKGLIRESYRIEGIRIEECRSIFLDWAMTHPEDDPKGAIRLLLTRHSGEPEDHPMTQVLREGLQVSGPPKRRGGRAGRVGPEG